MEEYLPSEIARLVLGYLKETKCINSWQTFLVESSDLKEYYEHYQEGKIYPTNIDGNSLLEILREYYSFKCGASKQCDTLINCNKASNPLCFEDKSNQKIQAQFSITSSRKRKRNAELPYKPFNESGSPHKKRKRRVGTCVKAFNFGPEAHKVYFCSGCVNFLRNFPNDGLYKKISKKISMNASKIVLVWQPFEKERFDSIPNHFIEFGAVKDVREWWAKNGNSYEIGFHVVAYFDEEAANRAVHGLPLVSSNVRIMTLRHLLLAAAEIESSCSDVSNVALQVEKFPQSVKEKEKDLWLVFNKYVPVIDIQQCDQDPTKLQFDVTYKYFTHALAAEISTQVQIKARYKYSVSMRQTSNTQKILKLLKAKLSCHFQENSPPLFAFKEKLMFKNFKISASSQDQLMISQDNISCSEMNVLQQKLEQRETLGHEDLQSRCSKEMKSHLVRARAELLQKIGSKRMEKNRNWQLRLKKCTGNLIKHKLHLSKSKNVNVVNMLSQNPKKIKKRKQKKLPFDQVAEQKVETAVQTEPILKQQKIVQTEPIIKQSTDLNLHKLCEDRIVNEIERNSSDINLSVADIENNESFEDENIYGFQLKPVIKPSIKNMQSDHNFKKSYQTSNDSSHEFTINKTEKNQTKLTDEFNQECLVEETVS